MPDLKHAPGAEAMVDAMEVNHDAMAHAWRAGWSVRGELERPLPRIAFQLLLRAAERQVTAITAQAIEQHARVAKGARPQCAQGCHHCCFQTVEVSTLEVMAILAWLEDEPAEAARLRERATTIAPKVAGLSKPQRYDAGIPCPALDGRRCGIYDVRPVACRTYLSLSRSACDRDWARRGQTPKDHWTHVPLLVNPQIGAHSLMSGVHAALHAAGLELERVELAAGLALALSTPDALDRWLAGERLFGAVAYHGAGSYGEILDKEIATMVGVRPDSPAAAIGAAVAAVRSRR